MLLHVSNFCTVYIDYDVNCKNYLGNLEFNWFDEGQYILQNICYNKVVAVNEEIEYMTNMTSRTIGGNMQIVDTLHFRQAIKCYTDIIFGIFNEDYNYTKTNKLLQRDHKKFIKDIACYPLGIDKEAMINLRSIFSYEEIFHMIYLIAIHKTRIQLTYISKSYRDLLKVDD